MTNKSSFKSPFSILAFTLFLTGCVNLAPTYERPTLPVAVTIGDNQTREAPAQNYQISWQEFVQQPQLVELIRLAIENNRDQQIALANIERYRSLYNIEAASQLPTVQLESNAMHQRSPADLSPTGEKQTHHQYEVGGALQFELDFFGRIQNLSAAALQRYLATESAAKTIQLMLIRDVSQAYAQYQAALQQSLLAEKTWQAREEDYVLQQQRYEFGLIAELAWQQAAQSRAQAKVRYEQSLIEKKQILNLLTVLVGTRLPVMSTVVDLNKAWFKGDILQSGLPSHLLLSRPDVQEKEHQLQAANADIGAARAAFFPSIRLVGTAGTASADLQNLFSGASGVWSFLPSIDIPIFNAGRNKASLAAANAEQKMAVAEYEKKIQTAFKEVADQLVIHEHIDHQLRAQKQSYQAAQRSVELADQRYELGADGYLQVLDAQRTFYSAQKELIDIALARQLTVVQLYMALGGSTVDNAL